MATYGSSTLRKPGKRFTPKVVTRNATGNTQSSSQSPRASVGRRSLSRTPVPANQQYTHTDQSRPASRPALENETQHFSATDSQFTTTSKHTTSSDREEQSQGGNGLSSRRSRPGGANDGSSPQLEIVSGSSVGLAGHNFDGEPANKRRRLESNDSSQTLGRNGKSTIVAARDVARSRSSRQISSRKSDLRGRVQDDSHGDLIESPRSENLHVQTRAQVSGVSRAFTRNTSNITPESSSEELQGAVSQVPSQVNGGRRPATRGAASETVSNLRTRQANASTENGQNGAEKASSKRRKKGSKLKPGQSSFRISKDVQPDNGSEAHQSSAQPETISELATKEPPKRRRRRVATPENADTAEITTSVVKMSDLCKDTRTGKKSKRAEEIDALDWTEVVRRQKERKARRKPNEAPQKEAAGEMPPMVDQEMETMIQAQPQMRIVNGRLVVDDSSLQVDRHAAAIRSQEQLEEIEENELTRRVNSASWLKREKTEPWSKEEIRLLYQGLRMFGTDFQIISNMFPLRNRHQIKLRFTKEERQDPGAIKRALSGKTTEMDLEKYSEYTGTQYDDANVFKTELDEKMREHEAELVRLRQEKEEQTRQQREQGERSPHPEPQANYEQESQKENEAHPSEVETANAVENPKAKKRGRKAAVTKKSKASQHSKMVAGEAEVLGTI